MPKRIQLSRRKGWRKPKGCIVVSRPSKWGNPFRIGDVYIWADRQRETITRERAVELHRQWALRGTVEGRRWRNTVRAALRGHDLGCWCGEGPCHAEVLLEIANSPREPEEWES